MQEVKSSCPIGDPEFSFRLSQFRKIETFHPASLSPSLHFYHLIRYSDLFAISLTTQNNNYSKNNNDKIEIGGKNSPSGVRVGGAIVEGGSVGGAIDDGGSVGGAKVVEGAVDGAIVVGCLVVGAIVVRAN